MVSVSSKSTVEESVKLMLRSNFSRLPVYEKHRENIVGVVYIKDLVRQLQKGKRKVPLAKVMNKPFFVPNSKKVSSLLKLFQKRKEHLAIVVDEHGSLLGLVTLEDVLEEIVGEIMDETEKIDPGITQLSRKEWVVKGNADIDDVRNNLRIPVEEADYGTLSGLILKLAGKIPKEGDKFAYKSFTFTVEEVDRHRISKVRVERL